MEDTAAPAIPKNGINKAFIKIAKIRETTFIPSMNLLFPSPLITEPESPQNPLSKLPSIKIPRTATGFSLVIKDFPAIIIVCSGKRMIKKPIANWISVTMETQ